MVNNEVSPPATNKVRDPWPRYLLIALVIEKIIQHVTVTLALHLNWYQIISTVAVNPAILMVLGAVVAVLFMVCLWGLLTYQKWALNLVIGLSLFDIVGEFFAQGTLFIAINVSFLVAILLLCVALSIRRKEMKGPA